MIAALCISIVLLIAVSLQLFRQRRELLLQKKEVEILKLRGFDFVANVSHELKTPLTSIKGYTETLKSILTRDPEKAVEFLNRIEENAERLSLLINDILELSRIEQPNFYLEKTSFKIGPLLKEIEQRYAFRFSSRHQVLSLQNSVDALTADRWLLDQSLSNLIENSHRYCPENALIEVSVSQVSEGGRPFIQFVVSDNGPGIKSGDLPRIFERFYRADKSRTRASGGTGLGLAIAKHIMLSHGGFIRAESQEGHGARFFLLFPK